MKLLTGDSAKKLKLIDDNSIDVIATDPPYIIYKLIAPNGKVYIGQTRDFYIRMIEHKHSAKKDKRNSKLYNSIRKYGWKNFNKEIIEYIPIELADEYEQHYIKTFDSIKNGLNCESGGNKNKKLSDETKRKLSEINKGINHPNFGKKLSETEKQNVSEGLKNYYKKNPNIQSGENNGMFGKKHSQETIDKISKNRKGKGVGRKVSDETKKKMIKAKLIYWKNKRKQDGIKQQNGRFPANLLVSDDILNDGTISKSNGKYNKTGDYENTGNGKIRTWNIEYDKINKYAGDSGSYSRYFDLDRWFEDKNN